MVTQLHHVTPEEAIAFAPVHRPVSSF